MIGIDFGTTNSCVAAVGAFGDVEALRVGAGDLPPYDAVLASSVLLRAGGDSVVGREAIDRFRLERTPGVKFLHAFKPDLDSTDLRRTVRVPVVERRFDQMAQSEVTATRWESKVVGGEFSRADLVGATSLVLGRLLEAARAADADDSNILLATPVRFSARARKRIVCALYGTGLFEGYADVLGRVRFIMEPVAAAASAMRREAANAADRERVLVFDHGGGTLDLSVVEFEMRPEFDAPVPVRELWTGGAIDVAGRSIDAAFADEVARLPEWREVAAELRPRSAMVLDAVENAKRRLSTEREVDVVLPGHVIPVDRSLLNRALAPILGRIEQEIYRVVDDAGLHLSEIDRVLMTGGSSLVPVVQDRVSALFDHLDETRISRYYASSDSDVRDAITEVAQGLLHFAETSRLQQLVLWDVDLVASDGSAPASIARRGDVYDLDEAGRPCKRVSVPISEGYGDAVSFGLYETELERRYLFGIADVPSAAQGGSLDVVLRPDRLLPTLTVRDVDGNAVLRDASPTGWPADRAVAADVESLPDGHLEEFFEEEADYLPDSRTKWSRAPLTRKLRVGDRIEWHPVGSPLTRRSQSRNGKIAAILRLDDDEELDEMDSWHLEHFELRVTADEAKYFKVRTRNGFVRLVTRDDGGTA